MVAHLLMERLVLQSHAIYTLGRDTETEAAPDASMC